MGTVGGPLAVGGDQHVRLPPSPAAIVQPNAVAGLYAWYKADSLGLGDGAAVTSWADSSGNGLTLTQATGANQPIFHTAGVNGLPAVTFDGVNDFLATAATTSPTTGVTVMVLLKPTAVDTTGHTVLCHHAAATWTAPFAAHIMRLSGATQQWEAFVEDATLAANRAQETPVAAAGAWQVMEFVYDQSGAALHRNGVLAAYTPRSGALTARTQPLWVGQDMSLTEPFKGDIAEILIYAGALSTTDRVALERYLMARAGLTNATGSRSYAMLPPGASVRSKGANIAMRHGPATGVGFDPQCWSDMWTQWEWSAAGNPGAAGNWIKPQIDSAKAVGCNTVHLLGSQYCRIGSGSGLVSPAPIDLPTYLGRWRQMLDYVRSIGLKAYVGFGGDSTICDFGAQYAYTPGASWLLQEYKDVAAMWAEYTDIIIGIDLSTEAKIWASNTANSQPIYNAVKAIIPSVSLSWSNATPPYTAASMVPASVLDHYDLHAYFDVGPSDIDAVLALGKPVILGEFGIDAASSTAARQARYNSVRRAVDRVAQGRWLAGAHVWSMYDQDTLNTNQYGLATAAGVTRSDVLPIFQSLPS